MSYLMPPPPPPSPTSFSSPKVMLVSFGAYSEWCDDSDGHRLLAVPGFFPRRMEHTPAASRPGPAGTRSTPILLRSYGGTLSGGAWATAGWHTPERSIPPPEGRAARMITDGEVGNTPITYSSNN